MNLPGNDINQAKGKGKRVLQSDKSENLNSFKCVKCTCIHVFMSLKKYMKMEISVSEEIREQIQKSSNPKYRPL